MEVPFWRTLQLPEPIPAALLKPGFPSNRNRLSTHSRNYSRGHVLQNLGVDPTRSTLALTRPQLPSTGSGHYALYEKVT